MIDVYGVNLAMNLSNGQMKCKLCVGRSRTLEEMVKNLKKNLRQKLSCQSGFESGSLPIFPNEGVL